MLNSFPQNLHSAIDPYLTNFVNYKWIRKKEKNPVASAMGTISNFLIFTFLRTVLHPLAKGGLKIAQSHFYLAKDKNVLKTHKKSKICGN